MFVADPAIAVRSRLMNAVFFFNEESREASTGNTSRNRREPSLLSSWGVLYYYLYPPPKPGHSSREALLRFVSGVVLCDLDYHNCTYAYAVFPCQ